MLKSFFDKIFEEALFSILLVLLIATLPYAVPRVSAIDWRVIAALWNLMIIAIALEELRFLDWIADSICGRFHSERSLALALIGTSMGLSMLITNDVALLTLVPITLTLGRKGNFNPLTLVALETVAANVGSSLTPFGNPQNIFLFNYFNLDAGTFLGMTAPFVLCSAVGLWLLARRLPRERIPFESEPVPIQSYGRLACYLVLFCLAVLSIVHLLPWQWITALIGVAVLVMDRRHMLQVDYFLLGTFILFFLLIDTLSGMEGLRRLLEPLTATPVATLWGSAVLSQGISNVPAAIVLAPFTTDPRALVLGVSLGGMGTLIASLANLIAFKLYIREYPGAPYLRIFSGMNAALFLAVGGLLTAMLLF